ncbi:MAG: hypothetical protein PHE24_03400 [Patescibacteria group bacterium]|nr:hypothetical protein [Patescibacteria group bacterium]
MKKENFKLTLYYVLLVLAFYIFPIFLPYMVSQNTVIKISPWYIQYFIYVLPIIFLASLFLEKLILNKKKSWSGMVMKYISFFVGAYLILVVYGYFSFRMGPGL